MKNVLNTLALLIAPFALCAQTGTSFKVDERSFELIAPFFLIGFLMLFIQSILKQFLDSRLKNKIVEKGVHENIVASLLQTSPKENRNINIKWVAILIGLGVGLTIVYYTLPLNYHSLAIMAFSLAASFLGYYLFIGKQDN